MAQSLIIVESPTKAKTIQKPFFATEPSTGSLGGWLERLPDGRLRRLGKN
jgi:reverse gyrase